MCALWCGAGLALAPRPLGGAPGADTGRPRRPVADAGGGVWAVGEDVTALTVTDEQPEEVCEKCGRPRSEVFLYDGICRTCCIGKRTDTTREMIIEIDEDGTTRARAEAYARGQVTPLYSGDEELTSYEKCFIERLTDAFMAGQREGAATQQAEMNRDARWLHDLADRWTNDGADPTETDRLHQIAGAIKAQRVKM